MVATGSQAPVADRPVSAARLFVVVLAFYLAGAYLAWKSFGSQVGPAYFYPAAGVTVAAMILTRRTVWPAVALAVVVAETLIDIAYGNPWPVALGYSAANVAEPLVGASLVLAWCGGRPDLRERRDLLVFIVGACALAPVVGALIGGTTTSLGFGGGWLADVLRWWAGDALGVLVAATPILLWDKQSAIIRNRPVETAATLLATGVVSLMALSFQAPPSTLIVPALAWAALRLNMIGASLSGALVGFMAAVMTSQGKGVLASTQFAPATQLALTQLFVGVVVVVSLLVAQEAANRVEALREHQIERRERLRLETLSRLAQQLSAALTPDDIGRALENHVTNDAGAKTINLGLLSHDGTRLEWVVMSGYPPPVVTRFGSGVSMSQPAVATDAVRTGQPVVVGTAAHYAKRYPFAMAEWLEVTGIESVAGWPLSAGGKPFGSLVLMWAEPQPFDSAQRAYISAVATMVSQALVRARVYADEHARAAVLQSALIPDWPDPADWLDVCVAYEPADLVEGLGGDWYDMMQLPDGTFYLAIGDVMGHGLAAVEDMAQLRSAGRALAHQGLPPSQLLMELNGFTHDASQGRFATMAVAILDPMTRTLSVGSAGHPPVLLRRAGGEVIRLGEGSGPVLGPLTGASYTESHQHIDRGDTLVLYTDGLVERPGMDIETGIGRAEGLIAAWDPRAPLSDECEALHRRLAPRPRRDDVCILAARFVG